MWYWIFRVGSLIVLKIFFGLKVEGLENLPKKTNFIVIANHASFLDPLIIAAAIPLKIHCIVSRYILTFPFLKWCLEKLEVLPVGRTSSKAIEFLMNNKIVGLFPEGKCSRDGKLKEFRRGVALLATKTGRPILPCAIFGAHDALPVKAKFPRLFRQIKVKVSKPIYLLKEFDELIDDICLLEGTNRIKNRIQEMLNAR